MTFGFKVDSSAPTDINYDAFFVTGLPILWIVDEILKYNPNMVLCDAKHFTKTNLTQEEMRKLLNAYSINKHNEVFCVLEKL